MDPYVQELVRTFERDSKSPRKNYNEFLAHVYTHFDKHISTCKTDKMMNKYKKLRNSVLSYIVANEKAIRSEICK